MSEREQQGWTVEDEGRVVWGAVKAAHRGTGSELDRALAAEDSGKADEPQPQDEETSLAAELAAAKQNLADLEARMSDEGQPGRHHELQIDGPTGHLVTREEAQ